MRIKVHKIGKWDKFALLAANLSHELRLARVQSLMRWGLKAEGLAKKHLSSQDLANGYWKPLAIYTLVKKASKGYPLDTLIETSTYFQSITSWVEGETAYAGVKRNITYKTGDNAGRELVEDIARIQEFGNSKIPARPLWQPVWDEVMKWQMLPDNKPGTIFLENIRKRYT